MRDFKAQLEVKFRKPMRVNLEVMILNAPYYQGPDKFLTESLDTPYDTAEAIVHKLYRGSGWDDNTNLRIEMHRKKWLWFIPTNEWRYEFWSTITDELLMVGSFKIRVQMPMEK